jgi:uncharacterized protein
MKRFGKPTVWSPRYVRGPSGMLPIEEVKQQPRIFAEQVLPHFALERKRSSCNRSEADREDQKRRPLMSAEANKQVVKKIFAELAAGNLDGFFACLTSDATWQVIGKPDKFALAGKRTMAEMRALLSGVSGALETPLTVTPVAFTCEGDRVAVEAASHADLKNGRAYRNEYHFLFEFRDGKIARVKEYLDTLHAKEILVDP